MELYNIDNSIVINNENKCMNILNYNDYRFWITGDLKEKRLPGNSFKITEYDRKLYKVFNDFYNSLLDEYNSFKDFNDFEYEKYPLYDEKHNCFTFYDDYSNVDDCNIFRIIKSTKKEPCTIGIYIRNNSNKLQVHTIAKSGSKYPQFTKYFLNLITDLNALEKDKIYAKKKEV